MADAACVSNYSNYHSAKANTCRCRVGTSTDPGARSASVGCASFPAAHESDQKTSHADERSHRHPTIRSKNIAIQTLPNGRSLSTARERPRNNEESRMKRFVFKGVLAARTNRFFLATTPLCGPPRAPIIPTTHDRGGYFGYEIGTNLPFFGNRTYSYWDPQN